MGWNGKPPTLLELVPAPVIEFDDFSEVCVLNGKCFWPLYAERPSIHSGEIERHLVGWIATKVENVPSMLERTAAVIRGYVEPPIMAASASLLS